MICLHNVSNNVSDQKSKFHALFADNRVFMEPSVITTIFQSSGRLRGGETCGCIRQLSFLPAATKLWPRLCFYTCVILFTRGGLWAGRTPPGATPLPPRSRHPQAERTPPGADNPPEQTPPQSRHTPRTRTPLHRGNTLQHTVNERPVRILLECILFVTYFYRAERGHDLFRPPPQFLCELSSLMVRVDNQLIWLPSLVKSEIFVFFC